MLHGTESLRTLVTNADSWAQPRNILNLSD